MVTLDPPYRGQVVRNNCESFGLSVTDAPRAFGVTRQALNNLVNGKSGISAEMAVRLEKAIGRTAEDRMQQQLVYDLALVRKREHAIKVRPVELPRDTQERLL